jgi:hypothetical protein
MEIVKKEGKSTLTGPHIIKALESIEFKQFIAVLEKGILLESYNYLTFRNASKYSPTKIEKSFGQRE